jgi:hypothetical protein
MAVKAITCSLPSVNSLEFCWGDVEGARSLLKHERFSCQKAEFGKHYSCGNARNLFFFSRNAMRIVLFQGNNDVGECVMPFDVLREVALGKHDCYFDSTLFSLTIFVFERHTNDNQSVNGKTSK